MSVRVAILNDCPVAEGARYAMRVLFEPLGVEVVEDLAADADAWLRPDHLVVSYGPSPPEVRASRRIHIFSNDSFWKYYLRPEGLPPRPFARVSLREAPVPLVVPFLGGSPAADPMVEWARGAVFTRLDFVASTFYFLTRYDEGFLGPRDAWGRVPEDRLAIVAEGLADRAPVDEYREVLRAWVARLLGHPLERPSRAFELLLTHDVDSGFPGPLAPFLYFATRGIARELLRHRSPRTALELGWNTACASLGRPPWFGGVRDIVALAERHGLTSHFFFMANGRHPDDATYRVESAGPASAVRFLRDAGHRVGLHAGIEAAGNPAEFEREWRVLREVLGREPHGVRTHFLCFDPLRTGRILDDVGVRMDSSAGFSNRCGFRTGTTHPHSLFDLEARRTLNVVEYPLALMDKAVYDLPPRARMEVVARIVETVRRHAGCLTVNWHYWYFTHRYRRLCEEVLAAASGAQDARVP